MPAPAAITLSMMTEMDRVDELQPYREAFVIPDGMIYLDGNSLGLLPVAAARRAREVVETEWGGSAISGWNDHHWIDLPHRVGAKIASLIGADDDEVIACDTTSANLFKVLAAALSLRPGRRTIVTNRGNFPTDVYIAEGLAAFAGQGCEIRYAEPSELAAALDDTVAAVSFTHVDYKSCRIEDMAGITALVHDAGALAVWDLAHSAGAIPVALNAAEADFAVGCGYKYLNGGPGAPAFLFAARRHHAQMTQPLTGWMGHASPFTFDHRYQPAPGIRRMLTGTPPVLALSVLERIRRAVAGRRNRAPPRQGQADDGALDRFGRARMRGLRPRARHTGECGGARQPRDLSSPRGLRHRAGPEGARRGRRFSQPRLHPPRHCTDLSVVSEYL